MAKSAKLREEQIWQRQQKRAEAVRIISGRTKKKKSKTQGRQNAKK